jgi:hypothetical protein
MSHQRNSTTLRGSAKESNLSTMLLQGGNEMHHRTPCLRLACLLEIFQGEDVSSAS